MSKDENPPTVQGLLTSPQALGAPQLLLSTPSIPGNWELTVSAEAPTGNGKREPASFSLGCPHPCPPLAAGPLCWGMLPSCYFWEHSHSSFKPAFTVDVPGAVKQDKCARAAATADRLPCCEPRPSAAGAEAGRRSWPAREPQLLQGRYSPWPGCELTALGPRALAVPRCASPRGNGAPGP